MRDLVIFGTGGYAREVCQVVEDVNAQAQTWNVLGFLDDAPAAHGTELRSLPVLGGRDWATAHRDVSVLVAVGMSASRWRIVRALGQLRYPTVIHPTAWIGNAVEVGAGTVILAGTAISTDISIGAHVCLNKNAIVGHDARLADHVTIAPGASISGRVNVGEGCEVGANSVIVQDLTVGEWSVVGAGAVVARDLPANTTAVGVPARVIKEREAGWQANA
jgi:sugar O-acyltransferase (sialic acid O-acetyltransferase NeuD family)